MAPAARSPTMAAVVCKPFASYSFRKAFKKCVLVEEEPVEPVEAQMSPTFVLPLLLAVCVAMALVAVVMTRPKAPRQTAENIVLSTPAAMDTMDDAPPCTPVKVPSPPPRALSYLELTGILVALPLAAASLAVSPRKQEKSA